MFSFFAFMKHYIYGLYLNDILFYIGMTKNPINRYKWHYYQSSCHTHYICRYCLLTRNEIIYLTILDTCNSLESAKIKERGLIWENRIEYYLLNKDNNPGKIAPIIPYINGRINKGALTLGIEHINKQLINL